MMHIPTSHIINTAEESQVLDQQTSEEFGINPFTLMEVAGCSAAQKMWDQLVPNSRGLFLCGKGNNGGDALVVARYLVQKGVKATIVFVSGRNDLSPLAQKNAELLQKIDQNDKQADITFLNNWDEFNQSFQPDFMVDGMLGTGLDSNLRGDIKGAVQWANRQTALCFSMDIPTGLHANSGQIMGGAVQADITFSFGTLKQGFYLNDGSQCRGKVIFCELPFPDYLKETGTFLIEENGLAPLQQEPASHKYNAGVVYVIAGSEGLTGAAMMAAQSAWSTGVGAVILICPHGLLPVFENNLPQVIKKTVGTKHDFYFKKEHLQKVLTTVQEKEGVALLGPGLGRKKTTVQFVKKFVENNGTDCIVDADGLWALGQIDAWTINRQAKYILTPHPGELQMLLDGSFEDDLERLQRVKQFASQKEVTLLAKGFPTIVGTKDRKAYLTGYDNRYFSRAGFGDVLAGKTAAYRSLGCAVDEACVRALLSGQQKMEQLRKQKPGCQPEPADFI